MTGRTSGEEHISGINKGWDLFPEKLRPSLMKGSFDEFIIAFPDWYEAYLVDMCDEGTHEEGGGLCEEEWTEPLKFFRDLYVYVSRWEVGKGSLSKKGESVVLYELLERLLDGVEDVHYEAFIEDIEDARNDINQRELPHEEGIVFVKYVVKAHLKRFKFERVWDVKED